MFSKTYFDMPRCLVDLGLDQMMQITKSYVLQNRTVRWNGLLGPMMDTRWVCVMKINEYLYFPSYNNRQKVLSSMCRYGRRSKNILSQYFVQPLLTDYWHLQQTFIIWTIFIYMVKQKYCVNFEYHIELNSFWAKLGF